MLGGIKLDGPAVIVSMATSVVALVCIVISATGMRPFGEAEMVQRIEQEDSQLCQKFGIQTATDKFAGCMSDLADLRDRHLKIVQY